MSDPIENVEVEEVETSLREDMEAAMSEVDENNGEEKEVVNVEETPKIQENETQGSENVDPTAAKEADGESAGVEAGAGGGDEVKAPQSWSPKLREEFSKLSPSIQSQISKRETEINKFQNEGAESRKFGEKMNQVLQPFQAVMTAQGMNDPIQAVQGLMSTAATLQMGSPQQKAQKLADLVQHYGIDIQALDDALSGQPQVTSEQSALEKMLEQKLAPMQEFMSSVRTNQQQSQQQLQQNANTEIQAFEQKAEFISDVRNDMADLLDLAAQRGQQMTLQEAYDKACAINPEISAVMAQRANDEKIKGNMQNTQNKRYAASSIKGNQAGGGGKPSVDTIEAALNQAWDDNMSN